MASALERRAIQVLLDRKACIASCSGLPFVVRQASFASKSLCAFDLTLRGIWTAPKRFGVGLQVESALCWLDSCSGPSG